MPYELDSYYFWFSTTVNKNNIKTACGLVGMPLETAQFILQETGTTTASGKTVKCTWGGLIEIAGGYFGEFDLNIMQQYGDAIVSVSSTFGTKKFKLFTHAEAEQFIADNTSEETP